MFVLTLVHGTWGRGIICPSGDAPWTTNASALCRSLRDRCGPEVVFRRFRWSGANSHTARVSAARKLRDYLQAGIKEWPNATHVVIAHSHGGNVALSAITASNLREKVAGIACLATPFISARERDIGPNPIRIFAAAVFALAIFLLWGLDLLDFDSWTWTGWGLTVLAGSLLMGVFLHLLRTVRGLARKLHRELTPAMPDSDQLLIIRSPADEASGAIAIFQFISQVTVRTFLFAQSWYARLEGLLLRCAVHKRKLLAVSVVGFVLSTVLLFGYAALSTSGAPSWSATTALIASGATSLVSAVAIYLFLPFIGAEGVALPLRLVVSALLWPIIAALSVLLVVPFGWQAGVANILLDVTAEPTPPGSWEIHLLEPPTSEDLGVPVPPLMHMVYENPHVLRKLGEWINGRGSSHALTSG